VARACPGSIGTRGVALIAVSLAATLGGDESPGQEGAGQGQGPNRVASSTEGSRRLPQALNFANALLNQRRYELAAEEYEKFLRTAQPGPDAADALYGLARAKLFLLKYDDARRHLDAFLKMAPDHANAPTARFRMGEAAYLMRDLPAAKAALEAFLQAHPDHVHAGSAWPYLGDARLGLGDLDGAREAYERALAASPNGPLADRARFYLARVLASKGEADKAIEALDVLAAREGSEWADRAKLQIGQILAGSGRAEEAVAALEALERANPGGPAVPEARLRRAEALLTLKRADEAEALLAPLASDASTPPAIASQAAYDLGGSLFDRGQAEPALAAWDAALKRFPGSSPTPMLLFRSAEALAKLDRPDEARGRYLKLVQEHPKDPWADRALLAAARLTLDARDAANARTLAAELPRRYPESPLRPNARLIEARALRAVGREVDAIPLLTGLLAEDGLSDEVAQAARYDLSLAYKATNQPERAAAVLAEMAKAPAAPFAANARYTLGQTQFDSGRFAEAVEAFDAFLKEEAEGPLAPHALAYLAVAHHELGDEAASDAALDRLAREWPESEDLPRVRLRLGEAALKAEKPERAAALFRPVAEGPVGEWSAQARSGLGWALVGLDQAAEAASAFGSSVEAAPDGPYAAEAAYMRAWSLEKAGQDDAALAAYADASANHPGSAHAPKATLARARLLARTGKPADAADAFAAYLKDAPADAPDLDAATSEHAWALREADRKDEADAAFSAFFDRFPDSPLAAAARVDLAKLAYADKALDAAETLLKPLMSEGSKADPAQVQEALYLAGRIAFDRSDWAAARALFGRLADEHPDGPLRDQARFWRAESAFHADDPASAEPEFAALSSDLGPDSEPWRATSGMRRIQCLVALKKWDAVQAEAESFRAKLPAFPQMAEIHYAIGRALQSQAAPRFADALAAYQAAIDASPGTEIAAKAQFMRGEVYFFDKDYRSAEREFLAVAFTYDAPSLQASALLESGKVAEADSRPADATSSYRKLLEHLEKFPDDSLAAEARKRLDALAGK
jgi:TolA-binding protein